MGFAGACTRQHSIKSASLGLLGAIAEKALPNLRPMLASLVVCAAGAESTIGSAVAEHPTPQSMRLAGLPLSWTLAPERATPLSLPRLTSRIRSVAERTAPALP